MRIARVRSEYEQQGRLAMRARRPFKFAIAVAIAGAVVCIAIPAAGAPLPSGAAHFKSTAVSDIEQVRWRGHRGGGGAVIGGIAAGMLLGGIIASSPYYHGGPYYYGGPTYRYGPPDWEAYCFSRYRSFDPYSGTYLGYDGLRHPCR
jgi:hypothetical protein